MSEERLDRSGYGLPHAFEAEKGLLGSVLLEPRRMDGLTELTVDAFHHPAHGVIWEALVDMVASNVPIDFITVTQWLEDRARLDDAGGAGALADLFTVVPTGSNVNYYYRLMRDKWVLRRVLMTASAMTDLVKQTRELDAEEVLSEAERMMVELRTGTQIGRKDTVEHCAGAVRDALQHIEDVYRARGKTVGLATGIVDWDRMTGGLMPGDMITIAGRPSHGKSALGMEVALHAARAAKVPTLVFSVEMPKLQLMVRALCGSARVNLQRVRDGFLAKNDIPNLMVAGEELNNSPLYIDDSAGLSSAQFRARARAAKVRLKIGLIVIDYLQFMKGSGKRAKESRQLEVSEISATIKAVAKELNIPVIALAQLNRDAEEFGKPKLSHLRDSGSIEQDSDQVLLIHRLDKKKGKKGDDDVPELDHNVLLLLEKQRNGPTGEIKLWFEKEFTTFRNVTQKAYSNREDERQQ